MPSPSDPSNPSPTLSARAPVNAPASARRVAGWIAAVLWLAVFLRLEEFKTGGFSELLPLLGQGGFWVRLALLAAGLFLIGRTEKRRGRAFEWSFACLLALPLLLRWPAVHHGFPAFQPMTVWILPWLVLMTALAHLCPRPWIDCVRTLLTGPKAGRSLYLALVLFYGGFTGLMASTKGLHAGDEGYYLLQTRSLAENGTLNLLEVLPGFNFTKAHYHRFHVSLLSRAGEAHSHHPFGLSLLLVPGYWVAGNAGAMAVLVLISSLLGPLLRLILLRQTGNPLVSSVVALLFSVSLPVSVYACRAYPELLAGMCYLFGYYVVRHGDGRRGSFLLAGVVLGFAGWSLTRRFFIPVGLINLLAVIRFWRGRDGRGAVAFLLPQVVMFALLAGINSQRFDGHDHAEQKGLVKDAGGASALTLGQARPSLMARAFTNLERLKPSRLVGVLLDKRFGTVWANAFLALWIPAAFWYFARWGRRLWCAGLVFGGMYAMLFAFGIIIWPAGACHEPRYLLAVIPFLALPFAELWSRRPGLPSSGGLQIALMCSLLSLAGVLWVSRLFDLLFMAYRTLNPRLFDLASFMPRFHAYRRYAGPQDTPHILAAAAGLCLLSLLCFSPLGERIGKTRFFGILLAVMFLMTAAATGWPDALPRLP